MRLRDKIRQDIKEHREQKWTELVESLEIQDNSLWGLTRKLRNKYKKIPPLKVSDTYLYDDAEKGEALAFIFEKQFQTGTRRTRAMHD